MATKSTCRVCLSEIINTNGGRPRTLCSTECRKMYSRMTSAASMALKTPEERKASYKLKNKRTAYVKRLRRAQEVIEAITGKTSAGAAVVPTETSIFESQERRQSYG